MFLIYLFIYFYSIWKQIRSQKENLKMAEAAEEQRLLRVQKNYIELEMRKFKRKKISSLHKAIIKKLSHNSTK